MPANAKTIRHQLLDAIQARLEELPDGPTPSDAIHGRQFTVVALGPLGEPDHKKVAVVGIVPGREVKKTRFPITDCTLPITIEMRLKRNQGDETPGDLAERYLGTVQEKILQDTTFGGISIDAREVGNDVDLDDYADKTIQLAVFIEVLYRHATKDPTAAL